MLVLINGITGGVGKAVAKSLLARGHKVRGLSRNAQKLDASIYSQPESFVEATSWYDAAAHDKACAGVDAIVNASAALPHLMLEGALLLLRAAERAGVKIFVAAAWSYNWTKIPFGYHEAYNHLIMFKEQVELTSEIKPIYIFTGILAEYWFKSSEHMENIPVSAAWDPGAGTGAYFGDGKTRHQLTTLKDTGEYTAELAQAKDAVGGGCFEVMSFADDIWDMKETYERVTGKAMDLKRVGSFDDLREMALAGRKNGKRNKWLEYIGLIYLQGSVEGDWLLDEHHLYTSPNFTPQPMADHLEEKKEIFKNCPNKKTQL